MHSAEKTKQLLDVMRQNTKALSNDYKKKYESLRNTFFYSNIPLVVLTTCNAGYVVWKYFYEGYDMLNIASDIITLSTASMLVVESTCLNPFNKLEEYSILHSNYKHLEEDIEENETGNKDIDLPIFEKLINKYRELTKKETIITKLQGSYEMGENALVNIKSNVEDLLNDHWNIIFRPTLRRFKQKNDSLMSKFQISGNDIEDGNINKKNNSENNVAENQNSTMLDGVINIFKTKEHTEETKEKNDEKMDLDKIYNTNSRPSSPVTTNPSKKHAVTSPFNMNFYGK